MLFCQTRLNGAKGEEKPMHKQGSRSVSTTLPLESNSGFAAVVSILARCTKGDVFLPWLPGY